MIKHSGWDGEYYYYDYYNTDGNNTPMPYTTLGGTDPVKNIPQIKLRDPSVTKPLVYETYTYSLGGEFTLTDFVLANSESLSLTTSYYEIYANTGEVGNLYDSENLIYTHNGHKLSKPAYASYYGFEEGITATNFGIKVLDTASFSQINSEGDYFVSPRISFIGIFGEPAQLCIKKADAANQISSIRQTENDETENYSIPGALAKAKGHTDFARPSYVYYRDGSPMDVGEGGDDPNRLWNEGKDTADVRFSGTESYRLYSCGCKQNHSGSCTTRPSDYTWQTYNNTSAEIFYDFYDVYTINEIVFATHNSIDLRSTDLTFYASKKYEDLYSEDNKIAHIEENGDPAAVVTIVKKGVEARYVGVKIGDICYNKSGNAAESSDYIRLTEFNVFGKFKEADDTAATITSLPGANNAINNAMSMVAGKDSIIRSLPTVELYKNGTKAATFTNTSSLMTAHDGKTGQEVIGSGMQHQDDAKKVLINENTYTRFFYDLGKVQPVEDVFVAHKGDSLRAGYYTVYVSADETIDESDLVAKVNNMGAGKRFENCANLISLDNISGRYVEIRIYRVGFAAGFSNGTQGNEIAGQQYWRIQEIGIYADQGYKITQGGPNQSKQAYYTANSELISNSLIADAPMYSVENVSAFNFGQRAPTAPYQNMVTFGSEQFFEVSKAFTETTYYDTDGDLQGIYYTDVINACSGTTSHTDACPKDSTCKATVIRVEDPARTQTVVYKLNSKAEISKVGVYHTSGSTNTRVTSHYLISFADSEADLFGTNSKTFEIQRVSYANSDIIELDEVVTAKYFAIKVLNGVCAVVDNAENKNGIGSSNYARIGHISLGGESLACENDAHNWGEDIIDVAADCQNPGSKHKECIDCGAETEAEEIPVTGHNHVGVETLKPSCDKLGVMTYTCPDCGDEYTENIPMIPHTETEIPAVAPECEKDGSTAGVKCSVCGKVLEEPQVDPATGHDWKLDKENEVKYCANECGKTIDIFVITFLSKDGDVVFEAIIDNVDGAGKLTDKDVAAANEAIPYIYGYEFTEWDNDVSVEAVFSSSITIQAQYERLADKHSTGITYADDTSEALYVEFDQRFTITDNEATAFLINGQVVGGEGSVTLYGCGELNIEASKTVVADGISVAIMKTVIDDKSMPGENVLRVFTNIYNPNNDVVTESGVIFLPGSIYDAKVIGEGKEFDLDLAKELGEGYAYVASSSANANQLLVTYGGIATDVPNLRRVSRAYAIINGQTYYSNAIVDDMFNK